MFDHGMSKRELEELLDQIVEVLEDVDTSSDEKVGEIESIVLGDEEEED
jgi:hypothetical protein